MMLHERPARRDTPNALFARHFTFGAEPFVLARVPALPAGVAAALYRADDPYAAALDLFRSRPEVAAAITIASPSLYEAVLGWERTGTPKNASVPRKLFAYAIRMATRPTPFGTFAGAAAVETGSRTSLAAPEPASLSTRSEPDAAWIGSFLGAVAPLHALRPETVVYANDCTERAGERIAVLLAHASDGSVRAPVTMRAAPAVEHVLERCRGGATVEQLSRSVAERFATSPAAADALLERLWQAGLIVPEIAFPRADSMLDAAAASARSAGDSDAERLLRQLAARLAVLDATPLRARSAHDYAVACADPRPGSPRSVPLHVRTSAQVRGTLGPAVLDAAAELATKLLRMRPPFARGRLRAAFAERYGAHRLLPVVDFCRLFAEPALGNHASSAPPDAARERALARITAEAIATKSARVVLSDADLDALVEPFPAQSAMPDSMELGFQIAAASAQAIDDGRFMLVPAPFVGSVPAGKTTARLASALGERTRGRLGRLVTADDGSGAIVAELAYIPRSLTMLNVSAHDTLHRYEIQLGFHRDAPGVTRLSLDDLYVGIDGERFSIWCESLQRYVRVVESHALAHGQAPMMARALLAIADDGIAQPSRFSWGAQEASPFLPRLESGACVLSLARWLVPDSLARLSGGALFALALDDWRGRWNVPAGVALRERDSRLRLDLTTNAGRDLLRDACAGSGDRPVVLEEVYPSSESAWFAHDGEAFDAEFVVCIAKRADASSAPAPERVPGVVRSRLAYPPGSDWCRLEFAHPSLTGNLVLRQAGAFIAGCRGNELLRSWSFRYAPDAAGLEFRFQAVTGHGGALLAHACRFVASLLEVQPGLRAAFTTYEPELELHPDLCALQQAELLAMWSSEAALRALVAGAAPRSERIAAAAYSGSLLWECADALWPGAVSPAVWQPYARPKLHPDDWSIIRAIRAKRAHERPDLADLRGALGGWFDARRANPQRGVGAAAFVETLDRLHFDRFGLDGDELTRARRIQARIWATADLRR